MMKVLLRIVCGIIGEYHFFERGADEGTAEPMVTEAAAELTVEAEAEAAEVVEDADAEDAEGDVEEEEEEEEEEEGEGKVVPANIIAVLRSRVIPSLRKHLMGEVGNGLSHVTYICISRASSETCSVVSVPVSRRTVP